MSPQLITGDGDGFPIGMLQPAGEFSYDRRSDRWRWSEEMYRIHGFEPGEIVPTTDLLLRHKDPEAGTVTQELVQEAIESAKPAAFRHRIRDAAGRVRTVVTVWKGVRDPGGKVVRIHGYMTDVTSSLREDTSSAVTAAFEHRAVIDQAKGMLMLVHGISADEAFGLLQSASCATNTKLYALAQRLVHAFSSRSSENGEEGLAEVAAAVLADGRVSRSEQASRD